MALASTETYRLEKSVWSEADFEKMGWHDVVVHALAFDTERYELLLDIDYLFAWVDPAPPSEYFSFWLAPATMVFRDVWELKIEYEASLGFQLQGITRSEPRIRPHPHVLHPRQAPQHVGQIFLRIYAPTPATLDDRIDHGAAPTRVGMPNEQRPRYVGESAAITKARVRKEFSPGLTFRKLTEGTRRASFMAGFHPQNDTQVPQGGQVA